MVKRTFDLLLATVGMLLFAPIAVAIAALIKLEDGGPVFFAQDRVGRDCRVFRVLKFRSMVPDAERETGPIQASRARSTRDTNRPAAAGDRDGRAPSTVEHFEGGHEFRRAATAPSRRARSDHRW